MDNVFLNKKKMGRILVATWVIGALLLLSACGRSGGDGGISVGVVGSSSVAPLAEVESEYFLRVRSDITIDVQSVGSSAGIKAVTDGTAMIGMSSRNLKENEKMGLEQYVVALDGIAVIVHPSNPATNLSKAQLLAIFKGEIRNWKEVGGKDAPIVVVSREEGSGTRGAFEEMTGLEGERDGAKISLLYAKAIITDGNGSVKQNIALKANGIGYISVGSVDDSVKAIGVNGIFPTEADIKAGTYPIARPFLLLTKGTPTPEAQAFIDFILSVEGQKIVQEHYYIPVR